MQVQDDNCHRMFKKTLKFNDQLLNISYQSKADLSVIEEFFIDKMYRSLDKIIPSLTYPILDIGAHIGCFSLFANALNSKIKIIALEPEPNNFKLLKENLKVNHCKNVTAAQQAVIPNCHPEFISGSPGMLKPVQHDNKTTILYLNTDSHNHSTFYETENTLEVPATTLENLISKSKLEKISLLKMDIEGAEFEIFKNTCVETWSKIQYIVVEYHELCTTRVQSKFNGNKKNDLENVIRSHGFSVEHFPNHYDKRFGLFICRNKRI
ncbi:MAG: FkbM family methyltransferase [Candidatus Magasanikbacteria bacterium GW2011_GWC2_37_14]|uniref:FkbM family methyltransferase n=1 Tax=Candidatus Magasanikbacteria bacterium GW2011_GWC2_37_14 TaxID=1619046 RepID=A0A0G0GBT2_9BACT|nr:MAG: FkbM family methyltransferase [Candidatus Magasanikbacteria bacterium GW2011_GWC2_37_14]